MSFSLFTGNLIHFCNYSKCRNKAKVIQYQGQLIRKVSTTSYLNERQDAMQVVTFSEEKGDPKEKGSKLSRDILKMMVEILFNCC